MMMMRDTIYDLKVEPVIDFNPVCLYAVVVYSILRVY